MSVLRVYAITIARHSNGRGYTATLASEGQPRRGFTPEIDVPAILEAVAAEIENREAGEFIEAVLGGSE